LLLSPRASRVISFFPVSWPVFSSLRQQCFWDTMDPPVSDPPMGIFTPCFFPGVVTFLIGFPRPSPVEFQAVRAPLSTFFFSPYVGLPPATSPPRSFLRTLGNDFLCSVTRSSFRGLWAVFSFQGFPAACFLSPRNNRTGLFPHLSSFRFFLRDSLHPPRPAVSPATWSRQSSPVLFCFPTPPRLPDSPVSPLLPLSCFFCLSLNPLLSFSTFFFPSCH